MNRGVYQNPRSSPTMRARVGSPTARARRRSIEARGGTLRAKDLPNRGVIGAQTKAANPAKAASSLRNRIIKLLSEGAPTSLSDPFSL